MLDRQVAESLPLDYSLSFRLDIDVISAKQSLVLVLLIFFFQSFIHNSKSSQLVFYEPGGTASVGICLVFDLKIHISQFRQLLKSKQTNKTQANPHMNNYNRWRYRIPCIVFCYNT